MPVVSLMAVGETPLKALACLSWKETRPALPRFLRVCVWGGGQPGWGCDH